MSRDSACRDAVDVSGEGAAVSSTSALIAIVHNYMPSGSGITPSFGWAAGVVNLLAMA
jgi:hypothetical protein